MLRCRGLRAEVIRRIENTKQFGTVSDIACMNVDKKPATGRSQGLSLSLSLSLSRARSLSLSFFLSLSFKQLLATTLLAADSYGDFAVGGYGGVSWLGRQEQAEQRPVLTQQARHTLPLPLISSCKVERSSWRAGAA